ncbi:hypothetical protein C8N43_2508 [Litoreibacter ponti]|uniref:Uncharacterized protein n=2 Tax=Litoreibacter ponti TaxID=1510457 RepID=A0A2T6BP60_9RHOB|nr:hypothetical protein C8N43_2508 [Litoreibacter ponti]
MKNVIATALVTLSLAAPASAQVLDAQSFFASFNDSAAERSVSETSTGNVFAAQVKGASANASPAESQVEVTADVATKAPSGILAFFAKGNDSAAERIAK